MLVFSQY